MAPYPFSDRPNNYDEGRVLNWSGDDNSYRLIGLVKFKLGLFEFVLPTWSMTDDHEDNINMNRLRLSSVPNPTTRRKKKDEKANRNKQTKKWDIDEHTNTHITSHIDQSSQHLQQIQEKLNEEKKLATVAYIIIIPNDDGSKR